MRSSVAHQVRQLLGLRPARQLAGESRLRQPLGRVGSPPPWPSAASASAAARVDQRRLDQPAVVEVEPRAQQQLLARAARPAGGPTACRPSPPRGDEHPPPRASLRVARAGST